jgi:hypothetical protein
MLDRSSGIQHLASSILYPWLVITADGIRAGRGVRGYTLAWFLRTYFGRRHVRVASPDRLRRSPIPADTLLLGLPSSLSTEEIERLIADGRYRRVVLFDYLDEQRLAWTDEQEPALRALSRHYLKPWLEHAQDYGLKMGMLPIRRSARLTTAIMLDRLRRRHGGEPAASGPGARRYKFDVAFLGQPNDTQVLVDGQLHIFNQRFQWLSELRDQAPDLSFWGGFIRGAPDIVARLQAQHHDFASLCYPHGKVNFSTYYRALQQSRVLLAPGGNAPWTYRHYEALYAGGVLVTIDFRNRDMLVPLPTEGVVHVPDGAPVVPYIREALDLHRRQPIIGHANIAHLEQYLCLGNYSRSRPKLIERFTLQLE